MEKSFEKFCARVNREREGMPVRSKYADAIVEEALRWVAERSSAEVAEGLGVSKSALNRWKRFSGDAPASPASSEGPGTPPVLNVTRISVAGEGPGGKILARIVRGAITVEFFNEDALARSLQEVLA